ncbi:Bax1-I domain-containing protein [Cephalotus follicularis]|uniref:Bax1-I domain-containing protein n=1 Tax=Cephalotus follicularis TaxID=3775 RepID=A0A1Q3CXX4_CEPFO|nr:Bax1-I domain-containing protein [Cephalotus follicularis]
MLHETSRTSQICPRITSKYWLHVSTSQLKHLNTRRIKKFLHSISTQARLSLYTQDSLSNHPFQNQNSKTNFFSVFKMWAQPYRKSADVEVGARPLYPMMLEIPELRWSFIRKVYSIIAIQLLVTIAVGAAVVYYRPIATFFVSTGEGLALYILLIFTPFIVMCPLYYYHQKHPVNYILLGIFTISLAFAVGLTCAFTSGKVILESVILTTGVVLSLTLFTFWASRRGYDFNFLGPFLFGAVFVLILFALIQVLFPLGKISVTIYGCLASIIFCGYIVYDTDNLIKRYTYDDYIWAAVALYLDIINLFLSLLTIFRATD